MNAVGIDVSKGKSTVTIRRLSDVVLMPPCDIPHTQTSINSLITTELFPIFPNFRKRKTLQSEKRLQRFLNPIQF